MSKLVVETAISIPSFEQKWCSSRILHANIEKRLRRLLSECARGKRDVHALAEEIEKIRLEIQVLASLGVRIKNRAVARPLIYDSRLWIMDFRLDAEVQADVV